MTTQETNDASPEEWAIESERQHQLDAYYDIVAGVKRLFESRLDGCDEKLRKDS